MRQILLAMALLPVAGPAFAEIRISCTANEGAGAPGRFGKVELRVGSLELGADVFKLTHPSVNGVARGAGLANPSRYQSLSLAGSATCTSATPSGRRMPQVQCEFFAKNAFLSTAAGEIEMLPLVPPSLAAHLVSFSPATAVSDSFPEANATALALELSLAGGSQAFAEALHLESECELTQLP